MIKISWGFEVSNYGDISVDISVIIDGWLMISFRIKGATDRMVNPMPPSAIEVYWAYRYKAVFHLNLW